MRSILTSPTLNVMNVGSCVVLLLCTVCATIFAELSKSEDGTFPYNTFVIPCAVEALKLSASALALALSHDDRQSEKLSFTLSSFLIFALPAFCYFVSNNCMFYIIRQLGPTTYQITNNLKVFSTAIVMRLFLARKLSWMKWKALVLLVLGSIVAELNDCNSKLVHRSVRGYLTIVTSCFASSMGGVLTETLLKRNIDVRASDSIHWQNIQLYFFGVLFGLLSFLAGNSDPLSDGIFAGFNLAAYSMIMAQAMLGISVSFVLKYIDNIVKCFVAAVSMLCVAIMDTAMRGEIASLQLGVGVVLTFLALEQYSVSD